MNTGQSSFQVRCEWGEPGIGAIAQDSDVIIIVDVLSFSTAVEIAVARGARVYPTRPRDTPPEALAQQVGGQVASLDRGHGYSLSPASLQEIPPGMRLVLPSANGSALSLGTGRVPVIAGCLRNAAAVARVAARFGTRIAIIPAGERWPDGSLRFAIEDWLGAGAIAGHLTGSRSPEASLAAASFQVAQSSLAARVQECSSGQELVQRGFQADVMLAAEHDVSVVVPILQDGAFTAYSRGPR